MEALLAAIDTAWTRGQLRGQPGTGWTVSAPCPEVTHSTILRSDLLYCYSSGGWPPSPPPKHRRSAFGRFYPRSSSSLKLGWQSPAMILIPTSKPISRAPA